ncbi:MAG TPA: hypothetical protein PKD61_02760 [Polyangiaceae bacterium]|nr:hypothetical protein [Polyangiaceae bacterium]
MTTAAAPLLGSDAPRGTGDFGKRVLEFMIVGGATLVLFPFAWLYHTKVGVAESTLAVGMVAFYLAHVINDPHFAVTYLLFYKDVKKRAFGNEFTPFQKVRYWLAGLIVPVTLFVWGVLALSARSPQGIGLMVQLMYVLVGWHYVKQGFGVLTVLSARRGVRFTPLERRVVLTHCFSGWAYGWATPRDFGSLFEESGVVYRSLGHPPGIQLVSGILFFGSGAAMLAVFLLKWHRERRVPPLAPLSGLVITIWLWTVYSDIDPVMAYVIPGLHSIQYLYFVWLLKSNEARAAEGPPRFGRTVAVRVGLLAFSSLALGYVLLRAGPEFMDTAWKLEDPGGAGSELALGLTPFAAVIVTFVNIHHYFMDHVIWRRENPMTRYLRG